MSLSTVRWLLAAIVCCFVLATIYISLVIVERQRALMQISRYNVAWTVAQIVSEYMRLEHRLAAYAVPGSGVSFDEVQLRLDIMFSRIQTFEGADQADLTERPLRQFIRRDPQNEATLANMRRALESVDAAIAAHPPNVATVLVALEALQPLDSELGALGSSAVAFGAARTAEDQRELQRFHLIFVSLAGGLILCGVALIVLLLHNNRLLGRARDGLSTLAAKLRRTSEILQVQNDRFNAALNNMSQALCTFDSGGRLVVFNERFAALTGLFARLVPGMTIEEMSSQPEGSQTPSAFQSLYAKQLALVQEARHAVFAHELPDGHSFAVSHEPLSDGGWLATYEDVSERQRAEARIAHMAHHDALTDLPNRIRFLETLERMLLQAEGGAGRVAVFFLDLDGFKDVNDTLGHQVGDELLKLVAGRLRRCIGLQGGVARLGGDEFAVVCSMTDDPDRNVDLAGRIVAELSSPYIVEGQEIAIGASIGVVESPRNDPRGSEELMRHADLALYRAKAGGKGRVCFFEPGMDTQLLARKALEADLRKALKRGQLEVHYQPLLVASTREICGYEALLRWKHPLRGQVPPGEFIPIAEDIGIIGALGEWVLRQACTEAAGWPSDITIAVNLSPVQFRSDRVMQTVVGALASSGLAPGRLELEITESVLLDASERTIATLLGLKGLGVRIAMDDFGTGYSSLSNLRSFPFDKIKIDRSFIRDLTTRPDALAVVRLIVGLGESLGMDTTAEGIETEEQFLCLQAVGCTQVQGFLFARPKAAHELVHHFPGRTGSEPASASVIDLHEIVTGVRNGRSYPTDAPATRRISAKGHET